MNKLMNIIYFSFGFKCYHGVLYHFNQFYYFIFPCEGQMNFLGRSGILSHKLPLLVVVPQSQRELSPKSSLTSKKPSSSLLLLQKPFDFLAWFKWPWMTSASLMQWTIHLFSALLYDWPYISLWLLRDAI